MFITSDWNLTFKEKYKNFTIAYQDYCCSFGMNDKDSSGGLVLLIENKEDLQQLIDGINFLKEKKRRRYK